MILSDTCEENPFWVINEGLVTSIMKCFNVEVVNQAAYVYVSEDELIEFYRTYTKFEKARSYQHFLCFVRTIAIHQLVSRFYNIHFPKVSSKSIDEAFKRKHEKLVKVIDKERKNGIK